MRSTTRTGCGSDRISIDEDSAELRGQMYGWNQSNGFSPDMFEIWGQYRYRFRRGAQGWKVTLMKNVTFHMRGNPAVSAARSPAG